MQQGDIALQALAFLVLLFSLTVHEAAHAWSAWRLGDPTARMLGRTSSDTRVPPSSATTASLRVTAGTAASAPRAAAATRSASPVGASTRAPSCTST